MDWFQVRLHVCVLGVFRLFFRACSKTFAAVPAVSRRWIPETDWVSTTLSSPSPQVSSFPSCSPKNDDVYQVHVLGEGKRMPLLTQTMAVVCRPFGGLSVPVVQRPPNISTSPHEGGGDVEPVPLQAVASPSMGTVTRKTYLLRRSLEGFALSARLLRWWVSFLALCFLRHLTFLCGRAPQRMTPHTTVILVTRSREADGDGSRAPQPSTSLKWWLLSLMLWKSLAPNFLGLGRPSIGGLLTKRAPMARSDPP